jgi:hypothetical protein
MKQPFGAQLAGFYMRLMFWIGANRKKEDAEMVFIIIIQNCQAPRATIVEFRAVEQFHGA